MKSQKLTRIETAWLEEVKRFNESPATSRPIAGELTVAHYQALLREIYFLATRRHKTIPADFRGAP